MKYSKIKIELDCETHNAMRVFSEYLDLSVEEFIADYLESRLGK